MLKLNKEDYEKILDHCRKGLPNESCGLLGGTIEDDVKTIEKVYLLTNIDESNEHFSMDPKEQLSAIKDIRQNGKAIAILDKPHRNTGNRGFQGHTGIHQRQTATAHRRH